jgi:hypothetical protein
MPELQPAQIGNTVAAGTTGWQAPEGTVQEPAIHGIAPHFRYNGPTFGWELSLARPISAHV